jgi:NAD(P)-dependent dehydrogenase (short-subunit alcohol dehydrogenase family)
MLSSAGHRRADVDLDDPHFDRTVYDPWVGYGRSKTANVLFAVEFDRRHRAQGVRATAVHPGVIWETELSRHMSDEEKHTLMAQLEATQGANQTLVRKTLAQGAATSVWAGFVAEADAVGGRYCEDCHVADHDYDEVLRAGVHAYALDPERAKALWALSETLTHEQF